MPTALKTPKGPKTQPRVAPTPSPNSTVTVGKVPGGEFVDVPVTRETTVGEVLRTAGIRSLESHELQVSGKPATKKTRVKPGDQILAVAKIRGG